MRSCGIVRENLKSVSLLVARDIGLVLNVGSRRLGTCYFLSLSHYITSGIKSHLSFRTVCFVLVLLVLHHHALLSLCRVSEFMLTSNYSVRYMVRVSSKQRR